MANHHPVDGGAAVRLLDTGNQDAILKLFQKFPKYKEASKVQRLQVLLFSATLHSQEVKSLASTICNNPILVDLKVRSSPPPPFKACVPFSAQWSLLRQTIR